MQHIESVRRYQLNQTISWRPDHLYYYYFTSHFWIQSVNQNLNTNNKNIIQIPRSICNSPKYKIALSLSLLHSPIQFKLYLRFDKPDPITNWTVQFDFKLFGMELDWRLKITELVRSNIFQLTQHNHSEWELRNMSNLTL